MVSVNLWIQTNSNTILLVKVIGKFLTRASKSFEKVLKLLQFKEGSMQ